MFRVLADRYVYYCVVLYDFYVRLSHFNKDYLLTYLSNLLN